MNQLNAHPKPRTTLAALSLGLAACVAPSLATAPTSTTPPSEKIILLADGRGPRLAFPPKPDAPCSRSSVLAIHELSTGRGTLLGNPCRGPSTPTCRSLGEASVPGEAIACPTPAPAVGTRGLVRAMADLTAADHGSTKQAGGYGVAPWSPPAWTGAVFPLEQPFLVPPSRVGVGARWRGLWQTVVAGAPRTVSAEIALLDVGDGARLIAYRSQLRVDVASCPRLLTGSEKALLTVDERGTVLRGLARVRVVRCGGHARELLVRQGPAGAHGLPDPVDTTALARALLAGGSASLGASAAIADLRLGSAAPLLGETVARLPETDPASRGADRARRSLVGDRSRGPADLVVAARAAVRFGDFEGARGWLQRVGEGRGLSPTERALAHLARGRLAWRGGRWNAAEAAYGDALNAHRDDSRVLGEVALWRSASPAARFRNPRLALAYARRVATRAPRHPPYLRALAAAAARTGETTLALAACERLGKHAPGSSCPGPRPVINDPGAAEVLSWLTL